MSNKPEKVGLIGVGTMGSVIADALVAAGRDVVVWDADPELMLRERRGARTAAESAAAVGELADVVLMSLPLPSDVIQVVSGTRGLLSSALRARHIIDMSTVDPQTTRSMASLALEFEVVYLDAPVLGRPQNCGHWTLPIGGDPADVTLLSPVLSILASRIVNVGPVGSGNVLKLLNNLMFGAINAVTAECMFAAAQLGLDADTFFEVVVDSGAATVSNLFREIGPKILADDTEPVFTLELLEKDNRLGVAMARSGGVDLAIGSVVNTLNQAALAEGLGALDTSALIQLLRLQGESRTASA